MDLNKIFQSKSFKSVIFGIIVFIIFLFIFKVGMFVGGIKAKFSYRWAESYHKNFAGPRGGFFGDWQRFPAGDFISGHGVFGQIIKIDPLTSSGQVATLIIKGQGQVEKIVLVKDSTIIQRFRDTIKLSDLKIDDYIIVIGEPNDAGQIEAKFIRLAPPRPISSSFIPYPPRYWL